MKGRRLGRATSWGDPHEGFVPFFSLWGLCIKKQSESAHVVDALILREGEDGCVYGDVVREKGLGKGI